MTSNNKESKKKWKLLFFTSLVGSLYIDLDTLVACSAELWSIVHVWVVTMCVMMMYLCVCVWVFVVAFPLLYIDFRSSWRRVPKLASRCLTCRQFIYSSFSFLLPPSTFHLAPPISLNPLPPAVHKQHSSTVLPSQSISQLDLLLPTASNVVLVVAFVTASAIE